MEANEIQEFVEGQEKARENNMIAVSFSISVLAVLVALVTVLSHRAHTGAVLNQARASDEWALYQAKRIRQSNFSTTSDLLTILAPSNPAAAQKLSDYKTRVLARLGARGPARRGRPAFHRQRLLYALGVSGISGKGLFRLTGEAAPLC